MKNNTTVLSKEIIHKIKQYFDYEEKTFLTKNELLNILNILKIKATIRNLLRTKIINCIINNQIYHVCDSKSSISELIETIFPDNNTYYFSGIYAYNTLGFIEQVPQRYQIINTKFTSKRKLAHWDIIFKKKTAAFLYGINCDTHFPYPERALLDLCYEYEYEKFLEIWEKYFNKINTDLLLGFLTKYPINAVARRVAYTLSKKIKIPDNIRLKLVTSSLIQLYSHKSRRGKIEKQWNLIINK
ncbi:hypothetical protein ACFL2K_02250 [Candidatus Margulisiibacteriota bacterium]